MSLENNIRFCKDLHDKYIIKFDSTKLPDNFEYDGLCGLF